MSNKTNVSSNNPTKTLLIKASAAPVQEVSLSKKKFSLDHTNGPCKEKISTQNLNYFISPRSSSEQIFKNLQNLAINSKNKTAIMNTRPILNNSKENSVEKENIFLKYLKENKEISKGKTLLLTKNLDNKKTCNPFEIIESLEILKNRYKTLKEMNFLKTSSNNSNENTENFSKITRNKHNFVEKSRILSENNNTQNTTSHTINKNIEENSKKTNNSKKNYSGNISNILSTNTNSESEIHQKSNEKEQKPENSKEKTANNDNKTSLFYHLNKEKIMKIYQNMSVKEKNLNNITLNRNFSIPDNNVNGLEGKKPVERRKSLHIEAKNQEKIPESLLRILQKTRKVIHSYKIKEISWKNEKNSLNFQINELRKKLSLYENI